MDIESPNYDEAFKKLLTWIERNEAKLETFCHCNYNVIQNHANKITSTPTATSNNANNINSTNNKLHSPISNHNNSSILSNKNLDISPNNSTTNNHHANGNGVTSSTVDSNNSCSNLVNHDDRQAIMSPTTRYLNWKNVIDLHLKLQEEVEEVGKQLNCELKKHLNIDKSLGEKEEKESSKLEERWHKIWLKSLEQLVIVERSLRCPKHNSTLIGKPSTGNSSSTSKSKARKRPCSYPSNIVNRLEWDYNYTLDLTGCHKEIGSQLDLDSVDEQTTRNLTEFGENYEVWLAKEDEVGCIPMHSRPPSVEPAEKPELAKATVTSTNSTSHDEVSCNNLLMLTTPSSMLTVDATKTCSHNSKRQGYSGLRIFLFLLAILVLLYSSALFQEPHHMHKSYYNNQPPV